MDKGVDFLITHEYTSATNFLALTIKKEHKQSVIKDISKTTLRVSIKTLLYTLFLTFVSIVI